jgi:hypothetical protein
MDVWSSERSKCRAKCRKCCEEPKKCRKTAAAQQTYRFCPRIIGHYGCIGTVESAKLRRNFDFGTPAMDSRTLVPECGTSPQSFGARVRNFLILKILAKMRVQKSESKSAQVPENNARGPRGVAEERKGWLRERG